MVSAADPRGADAGATIHPVRPSRTHSAAPVLLVVMTPFTVFILVYLGYALYAFRARAGEEGAAIP